MARFFFNFAARYLENKAGDPYFFLSWNEAFYQDYNICETQKNDITWNEEQYTFVK